jgi:uncharacterized protein
MRKKEKEIADFREIEAILIKADICRLGLSDGGIPYIVPLNFGYRDRTLYFHTGHEGKKIDILKKNNMVCFEADIDAELIRADVACGWSMKYRSVVGTGRAVFVEDRSEKAQALDIIMTHYSENVGWTYREKSFEKACIIKVVIDDISGRASDN